MLTRFLLLLALLCTGWSGAHAAPAASRPVSFRYDVNPLLSRGGCNSGTCHGNAAGKGGLRLSLRGEDPKFDHVNLTQETGGRRVDRLTPGRSLFLLKPSGIMPHGGGLRFSRNSPDFWILDAWLSEGARFDAPSAPGLKRLVVTPKQRTLVEPVVSQQLSVRAYFSDGSSRDVTREAVYETSEISASLTKPGLVKAPAGVETGVTVRFADQMETVLLTFVPRRPGFVWKQPPVRNTIDEHVFAKLRTLRILPSGLSSDETFIRRAYLDGIGVLPTAREVGEFLADPGPDKRDRLIDSLLERPEFDDFWTLKWSDLLRVEERSLDPQGVSAYMDWIRQSVSERKPLDQFARDLLTAQGSTYEHPEANFYRRTRAPDELGEITAQLFMGVRMRCARCHNHPFDRWSQDDYYALAANFSRVNHKFINLTRRDGFDSHELNGEDVVALGKAVDVKHPRTGEAMSPRMPGEPRPIPAAGGDARRSLAEWLTRPDNPYFARAMANRIWYHIVGRGIVEPVDDFRASNPPANAPLLDALTADLVKNRFDLRSLVATIMKSRTYQLASTPNSTNASDERFFSHALVRRLTAEQLMDAISQFTGVPEKFNGYPIGMRALQLPPARQPNPFLKLFGRPPRETACECERSNETTLGQSFQMIAGASLDGKLKDSGNTIGRLLSEGKRDEEIVEELYLSAVSRKPKPAEMKAVLAHIARRPDRRREGLEDLVWGLLNSKEFLLRT